MKILFTTSLTWLCLLVTFVIRAQELPEIIPPSPTVANLMQFEEVPISYYTGQPNINIPIYSKNISSNLSLDISLSYNTQGIKINNRSSWVGTGWSLNAGGVISRTVRGIPDEYIRNSGLITGEGVLHNDDFWNYQNLSYSQQQEFLWNSGGAPGDKYDYELDLYQFNIMGATGRFIIVKEAGQLVAKLLSKNQTIKIELDYDNNSASPTYFAINKFTVIDNQGHRFIFDVKETSDSAPFTAIQYFDNTEYIAGASDDFSSINAWHLSIVENSNGEELVTFNYQTSGEGYVGSVSRTDARPVFAYSENLLWNQIMHINYNATSFKPRKVYAYHNINTISQKLQSIDFRDGTSINFELYNKSVITHPETNGHVLEYIKIKNFNQSDNKVYKFNYGLSGRLWLTSVDEIAGGNTHPYQFEYNEEQQLPNFDTVSLTDDWGYYKGASLSGCGIVIPSQSVITTGLLNKIIYPTGGSKEFEFERHQITYEGNQQLADNEYRDKNPDNWIPANDTFNFSSTGSLPQQFTLSQEQQVVYKLISTTANQTEQENSMIRITGPNNYVQTFLLTQEEVWFTAPAGTFQVELVNLNLGANYTVNICLGYKNFVSNIKRYVYGGGVRIKNIIFKDNPNDLANSKIISFNYDELGTQNKSSGSIDGKITGIIKKHIEPVTRHYLSETCIYGGVTTFNFEVTINSARAELTQGQYVGYKKVKTYETGNGTNVYTFTSAQDFYSPSSVFEFPYKPADDIDYKRGLLIKHEVFNNSTQLLKENINQYSFQESIIGPTYSLYNEDCEWKQFYSWYNLYSQKSPDKPMTLCSIGSGSQSSCTGDCIVYYDNCSTSPPLFTETKAPMWFETNHVKSTWARLEETTTKEYFYPAIGGPIVKEVRKAYDYNPQNYQVSVEDTYYDKSGTEEHLQTKYYYPVGISLNSNTGTVKNALVNLNKINEVLETQSYRNGVKLSEMHNIYHQFATNQVLLKEVKVGKNTLTPDKRIEFHRYDSYGNVLEVSKADGTKISYIYGFNGSLPVAKITNANYSQVESIIGTTMLTGNLTTSQRNNLLNGLSSAMINFLEHDPAVGITKTYNERALLNSYDYDPFNRLIRVKDHAGKVEGFNAYNYKNQY
jgi:hypothetical protein